MSKPFLTIENQINLLKQRGMIFNDEVAAKQFLLNNNYYNVINCFNRFVKDNVAIDQYKLNFPFDDMKNIYHFDRTIKAVLLSNLLDIERTIKSICSYVFSEAYPNKYAYLDINNYDDSKKLIVTIFLSKFSKIITSMTKEEAKPNSIYHYYKSHGFVPLWVLVNYLSFGDIVKFYSILKPAQKNKVARRLENQYRTQYNTSKIILNSKAVNSILSGLYEVRNRCAHDNRILEYSTNVNMKYINFIHDPLGVGPTDPKQSVYLYFCACKLFLSVGQFSEMHNTMLKLIKKLNKKLKMTNINSIINSIGFPDDWHLISPKM